MRRFATGLVVSACIVPAGAFAEANDPPPVSAPALTGPIAETSGEPVPSATSTPVTTPPTNGPGAILVIPGMSPSRRGGLSRNATNALSNLEALPDSLPALTGPDGMPAARRLPGPNRSDDGRRPADLTLDGPSPPAYLESIPGGDPPHLDALSDSEGRTGTGLNRANGPDPKSNADQPSNRRASVPRRPPGFLGRFLPQSVAERVNRNGDDAVRLDARDDPAADAALKRRIEKQVGDVLGPRLRSYEVRVVNREVTVRAHSAHFWQRRAVRRDLEALPVLNNVKARVEVDN